MTRGVQKTGTKSKSGQLIVFIFIFVPLTLIPAYFCMKDGRHLRIPHSFVSLNITAGVSANAL